MKIMENWGLKIASLISAAIIWLLVTNITDQSIWISFDNIPVKLQNVDRLQNDGFVVEVLDESDIIEKVSVYAPRSNKELLKSNIVATADLTNIAGLDSNRTVKIDVSIPGVNEIKLSHDEVKLNVEKKIEKRLTIDTEATGEPADNYIACDPKTNKTMLTISGANSVIEKVKTAKVSVDVTGFSEDFSTDEYIKLYDKDGKVVDTSNITMNINSVTVSVEMLETKFVPIVYNVTGEPADGYERVGDVESKPDKIQIAGKPKVISKIKAITVNDSELNITGRNQDLIYPVELEDYLPEGVSFADKAEKGKASVVVHISAVQEKTVDVDIKNVTLTNSIEGYEVKLNETDRKTLPVTLQGTESVLSTVTADAITGVVDVAQLVNGRDVSELKDGTYNAKVTWTLPNGVKAKSEVDVHLILKKND